LISCRNIFKSYDQLQVLKDVSLDINKGELACIIGALDKPDSGTVTINGQLISSLKDKELSEFRNQHLGFVFQFHHLLPEFTALENICIPAYIAKQPEAAAKKRATELLDYLGLNNRMHHKPNELSGGEQQRVSVARALMNHPLVILADEPTGNLVTHNDELAEQADRKLMMKDGLIIKS
jgi:lipoprotein-releasing system ATP-binding protein